MNSRLPRLAILIGSPCFSLLLTSPTAAAFEIERAPFGGERLPGGPGPDCMLSAYDTCSGWTWVFSDVEGAVWGVVLDAWDCPGGCSNDGYVTDIYLYTWCSSLPGRLNSIAVHLVDYSCCPVELMYRSDPITITHCASGDRWTHLPVPLTPTFRNPFAVTFEWGPADPGTGLANPRLASDNGIANLYCASGTIGFPGCESTAYACWGWTMPPQCTYIYVTDLDSDGDLEDLCALYSSPWDLGFPYVFPYGYVANNLIAVIGLDCENPYAVEPTSWGHVKALFQ